MSSPVDSPSLAIRTGRKFSSKNLRAASAPAGFIAAARRHACDRPPWTGLGSWTLEDETEEAGAEPDKCFIFGDDPDAKDRPDLAIEVAWSRSNIDKLEIYRRLEIAEVWYWKRDVITVYVLEGAGYTVQPRSTCLSGVDLDVRVCLADVLNTDPGVFEAE